MQKDETAVSKTPRDVQNHFLHNALIDLSFSKPQFIFAAHLDGSNHFVNYSDKKKPS